MRKKQTRMEPCSEPVSLSSLPSVAPLTQPGHAQAGDQKANYRCCTDVSSVSCLGFHERREVQGLVGCVIVSHVLR